jgi:hypothetical protein
MKRKKRRGLKRDHSGLLGVIASSEESPRRESVVDEAEERASILGSEKDESVSLEGALRSARATDSPLDISPIEELEGLAMGMVDRPDADTIAEYERGEEKLRREKAPLETNRGGKRGSTPAA